jgi:hypothetical protein
MTAPLIISFYTNDWEYPTHAERLREECRRLGLDHHIEEQPSTKDYISNTAIKPFFIRNCLVKFDRPILWLDVDGSILRNPGMASMVSDFAACKYQNRALDRDWAVGILWFNNTVNAKLLLDTWCNNTTGKTDEAAFDLAWKSLRGTVISQTLPDRYHFVQWRVTLPMPADTIFCNRLSTFDDKMRRKNKQTGQIEQ